MKKFSEDTVLFWYTIFVIIYWCAMTGVGVWAIMTLLGSSE